MIIFLPADTSVSALPSWLECVSVGSNPFPGNIFEFNNQFTVLTFQLIAEEYTGLKFTKSVFNPKPKALEEGGWTPKLIHVFADFVKQKVVNLWVIDPSEFKSLFQVRFYFSMSFERFQFSMFDKICKFWNWKVESCKIESFNVHPLLDFGLKKPLVNW